MNTPNEKPPKEETEQMLNELAKKDEQLLKEIEELKAELTNLESKSEKTNSGTKNLDTNQVEIDESKNISPAENEIGEHGVKPLPEKKADTKIFDDAKVLAIKNNILETLSGASGGHHDPQYNQKLEESIKLGNKTEGLKALPEKKKLNPTILEGMASMGLSESDFANIPKWDELSDGQKMLVIDQASQSVLKKIKKEGEERFKKNTAIKGSWNPAEWDIAGTGKKLWQKIGKSYYLDQEEKGAIKDAKSGNLELDEGVLEALVDRTADMNLNVIEQDGGARVEFVSIGKDISKEEKENLKKYNDLANIFAQMPDAWKGEEAAKSTDRMFSQENHEKYLKAKQEYEDARDVAINSKTEEYKKSGMTEKEAQRRALGEINNSDTNIAALQLANTSPYALGELKKIENTSSFKKLWNDENIWKSGYMLGGFGARTATRATLGLLAAPLVSGAIGGIRARRKARKTINETFLTGREEETFLQRKEAGKAYEDKSGFKVAPGQQKVNTKEVAGFIDADSQIKRLDRLTKNLEKSTDPAERNKIISELNARIDYIEDKLEKGLVNYGSNEAKAIGLGYKFLKTLSEAEITATMHPLGLDGLDALTNPDDPELLNDLREQSEEMYLKRGKHLEEILNLGKEKRESEQKGYINKETVKGVVTGAGLSLLGIKLKEHFFPDGFSFFSHNYEVDSNATGAGLQQTGVTSTYVAPLENTGNASDLPNTGGTLINPETASSIGGASNVSENANTVFHNVKIEAVADHGQGAISTIRELQAKLEAEYGSTFDTAPASVRHILNTPEARLAEEYGMYKPNDISGNESAMLMSGDKLVVNENGDLVLERINGSKTILEGGIEDHASGPKYDGKMFDSDHGAKLGSGNNLKPLEGDGNNPPSDYLEGDGNNPPSDYTDDNSHLEGGGDGNNPPSDYNDGTQPPAVEDYSGETPPPAEANTMTREVPMTTAVGAGTGNTVPNTLKTGLIDNNYENGIRVRPGIINPVRGIYDLGDGIYQQPVSGGGNGFTNPVALTNEAKYEQILKGQGNGQGTVSNSTNTPNEQPSYEPGSLENARAVRRAFRGYDVTMDRPGVFHNHINGLRNKTWNEATDDMFKQKGIKFESAEDYEREDAMQRLLGHAKQQVEFDQTLNKNAQVVRMSYFRTQPEWEAVKKIPANYFFNTEGKSLKDITLTDGTKLSDEQIAQIKKSDIFNKETGQFKNTEELKRISKVYNQYTPKKDRSLNNELPNGEENLQKYIQRMTSVVRTADKGTIYAVKDGIRTPISVKVDENVLETGNNNNAALNKPVTGGNTASANTATSNVISTDDATYHKVFPENETVQGMPRTEYDNEVINHLKNKGPLSSIEEGRKTDVWMWEKFGRVVRTEASQSPTGKIRIQFQSPYQNEYLIRAENDRLSAEDLMQSNKNSPEYVIGRELVELRDKIKTQTGTLIQPEPYETIKQYVKRLMSKI